MLLAPTGQNNGKPTTSKPQLKQSEASERIIQQLTILAEAFGETMTTARLKIYAAELADLTAEQLAVAFKRARHECRFFPKIAELRELAGAVSPENAAGVEAEAAFQSVIRTLEREGVDFGISHLPKRTQYAVRHCGGLRLFNQRVDQRSYAFLQRDFVEGYKSFTAYKAMVPELSEKGILALPQPVRLYIEGKKPVQKQAQPAAETTFKSKAIPQPLTDTQIQDRREMLRQQAEQIEARRTH